MAARPIWQGHLRLSLVACPVALYSATSRSGDVSFNLINPATGSRVRQITLDAGTGEEVERKELVRGYEYEKGRYVLLTNEELESVRLESTKTIDIERFVDARDINRVWWDEPHYLAPDGKAGLDAFVVIREAMRAAGQIALARVTMHTRERMVAIEPRDAGFLVTTLRSHDDIRDAGEIFDSIPEKRADAKMIAIAEQIIKQQIGPFDPSAFRDRYEDALRALIQAKLDGGDGGVAAPAPRSDNVIDLMEALRRSLDQGGKTEGERQRPAAKTSDKRAAPKPKPTAKIKQAAPAPRRRKAG
jgi:DNA end-binding protein Ku